MLSIITPVLNGEEFIEKNINEINKLNIPFEHIIVDGGSTDSTVSIIKKHPQVILVTQIQKTGMYGAIHQGIQISKGDYLAYVNADDRIIVRGYEMMYKLISKINVDVVYSDSKLLYEDSDKCISHFGNRFGKYFLKHGILPFIQPSSIFSKNIYIKVGGLSYNKFKICGDIDLFYHFAIKKDSKILYLNEFSSYFLIRKNSLGNQNSKLGEHERIINNIPKSSLLVRFLYRITNIHLK